jgi:hypothetical protein
MANDTNKKPTPSSDEAVSAVKTGDGKSATPPRALATPVQRINKKKVFVLLVLAALLAIWAVLGLHVGQKVYAQAAGHKIYKQDVKDLIGKTKGVSDRQAATVLADKYLTEAMAKEQKITITDKNIEEALGPTIKKQKSDNPYSYQLQVNQLYFDKLQAYNRGIYKGDLLVAHFSRFIPAQSITAADKAAFPALGDPATIAADKKYAKDFITKLYDQIKSGKMTWNQAVQAEHNDPVVGESMYPALSHSGPFDTSKAAEPLFTPPAAQNEARKLKAGQTSKPLLVKVSTNDKTDVESYFLVIRMDSKSGGQTISFGDYLSEAKQNLGYKVNV